MIGMSMIGMTAFEAVIILGGICGLFMVIGGMVLLYKGAISLNTVSVQDAVSLEFKKTFKITTQYPALGLFIIGLTFIISAALFSKVSPVSIEGKVKLSTDPSSLKIVISAGPWGEVGLSSNGKIVGTIYPNLDTLKVQLLHPLYESKALSLTKQRIIPLGEIDLGEPIGKTISPNSDKIKPAKEPLPPLSEEGKF